MIAVPVQKLQDHEGTDYSDYILLVCFVYVCFAFRDTTFRMERAIVIASVSFRMFRLSLVFYCTNLIFVPFFDRRENRENYHSRKIR